MDQCDFKFDTRGHTLNGKQKQILFLYVENNLAYFPFIQCPLGALVSKATAQPNVHQAAVSLKLPNLDR